ncbi:MAG: helix-turn-helix transcriptional regulator [Bauldia sp.]|nr:helix-turn-helix transcriptional regulator [Bauldia sp.]
MENNADISVDERIAIRLKGLRRERDWSLDELAERSGVSRATLSRLENGAVSPTASVLGRLCAAFDITLSRLMVMVEEATFAPLVRPDAQPVWQDPEVGFRRRSVSPPARELAGEVLECSLDPATRIDYPRPPRHGLEHHLYMLEGRLGITLDGVVHDLHPGDCLRYRLFGASSFVTPKRTGARYLLFMV